MTIPAAAFASHLQTMPLPPFDPALQKMQRFMRWLEENGAVFPAAQLHLEEGMREMRAKGPIRQGELVMHIPRSLVVTADNLRTTPIGDLLRKGNCELSFRSRIALFLLMTRRDGGFFQPYVDVLPEDMSYMPTFFSETELACLKGTASLRKIKDQIASLRREYRQVSDLLPPGLAFSEQEYAWAYNVAFSRLYCVTSNGDVEGALVPLADMMNHATEHNVNWDGDSPLGFICTAARRLDADTPLVITYGPRKGNGTLFALFGFTLENNPNDTAEAAFPELPQDSHAAMQANELGTTSDGKRLFTPAARYADDQTTAMFKYLRLYQFGTPDAAVASPVSRESELAVLDMLALACSRQLAEFGTADTDAHLLLAANENTPGRRDMARVREGEMRVLRYLLDLAASGTAFLNGASAHAGFEDYIDALKPLLSAPENTA